MEHSRAKAFKSGDVTTSPGLSEAISIARRTIAGITDLPIDAVSQCRKAADGTWAVVIDLIESPARLGDNDLLAAFEVQIDPAGEILSCSRTRRYRREDKVSA